MGVSTNGIIGFGVVCDEGTELPWDTEEFDGDIEEWWRRENDFRDIHSPWTPDGNYATGWGDKDPRLDEYYRHRREWLESHPVPIELENYCSGDCPMYALTVPGLGTSCRRGYPKTFEPSELVATPDQAESLKAFLMKYGIEYEGEPGWLLMSYWG